MIRCFLKISYIGSQFRGSQRSWEYKVFKDPTTVEGNLEIAFLKSPYKITSFIEFSSRTDSGVHALDNTAHVDLMSKNGTPVECDYVIASLNKYFVKNDLAIHVKQLKRVNPDFHCRKLIKSRTYLYRLAVPRNEDKFKCQFIQIEEWKRSWLYLYPTWNIDKFREGAALLVGKHDFETFRKVNKTGKYQECIKTLDSIEIEKTSPLITAYTEQIEDIDYYNILFKGHSFIHNQIRRIVGALNAVATDTLSLRELKTMLQVPSKHSWPSFCKIAPPFGLYLAKIEYRPKDLIFTQEDSEETK